MRVPMVTRTFKTVECKVVAVDKASREVTEITVTVPRIIKDDKKFEIAVETALGDEMKLVEILSTDIIRRKFGMPEQDFLNNAVEIDLDTEDESEDE